MTFAGTGSDAEDGALPASAFTWRVDFHHDDHTHPHVEPTSGTVLVRFVNDISDGSSFNLGVELQGDAG